MCRIGAQQDFRGLGVANVVFGVACIILPDHAAYDANNFDSMDGGVADFIRATAALTVINGIVFLTAGILLMVISRRMVENLPVTRATQVVMGLLIASFLMCPITFALNLIGTNDAIDAPLPTDGDLPSGPVGNLTVDVGTFLANFIVVDRALDYKYGSCASLTLIAVGCFFMNIACVIMISKQPNFRCFGRQPEEPPQMTAVVVGPDTSRIQYQNQVNDDRAVVIQPLPERPGAPAHSHFSDASVPSYRNSGYT